LNPFRIGQLLGRNSEFLDDPEFQHHSPYGSIEENSMKAGVYHLELLARPSVVEALVIHYGSISELFVALWNSDKQPRPPDYDDEDESGEFNTKGERYEYENSQLSEKPFYTCVPAYQNTEEEILMYVTGEKMNLWAWLDQGAEPLSRY
jgi:hypothetical protein